LRTERVLLTLASCLAVPAALRAANICVWNYDTLDRFYDAGVGDSVNCAYHVVNALTDLGHTVTVSDSVLPGSLDGFDAVFCLMGWYRC
jgi:hypothetical protein